MKITIENDLPIFTCRPPMPGETLTLFGYDFQVAECGWSENSADKAIQGLRLTLYPNSHDVFLELVKALPEKSK